MVYIILNIKHKMMYKIAQIRAESQPFPARQLLAFCLVHCNCAGSLHCDASCARFLV